MVEERGGWFVKNVKDATWMQSEAFGKACGFDTEDPFPQIGIHIFLLEPGKPNCRYHREEAQEDFLVLAGRCWRSDTDLKEKRNSCTTRPAS